MNFSSRLTWKSMVRLIATVAFALLVTNVAVAQEQEAEGIRFSGKTAVVRGSIGGEAHDSYVFHVRSGRKVTITIKSNRNRASFTVSKEEFGEAVSFGNASNKGNTWTGTIPDTGVYFISVVAHPASSYTLTVTKE